MRKIGLLFIVILTGLWLAYFLTRILESCQIPTAIAISVGFLPVTAIYFIIAWRPIPIRVYTIGVLYLLMTSLFFELPLWLLHWNLLRQSGALPVCTSLALLLYAWLHGRKTVLREVTLETAQPIPQERIRIGLISDVHMGLAVTPKKLRKDMELLEEKNPDFLVIAGDLVDDQTTESDMIAACEILGKAAGHFSVFFAYGNHDMASHGPALAFDPKTYRFCLERNGITVLDDNCAEWNGITIVGRLDQGMRSEIQRKPLAELLPEVNKPFIVIDHQPSAPEEAISKGALMQLSGHTHGGQVWPANVLMRLVSDRYPSYGWKRVEQTWLVTSCGLGTRGSTLRSGTTAEMLLITLRSMNKYLTNSTK